MRLSSSVIDDFSSLDHIITLDSDGVCWSLLQLQNLKIAIKTWRKRVFGVESVTAETLRNTLSHIDSKAKENTLSQSDIDVRIEIVKLLTTLENNKINDLRQKAKIRWALKESNISRPRFSCNLFKHISLENVTFLELPFTSEEIKDAVWNCGGDKASRPDRFTFELIKKHWNILGNCRIRRGE
ncbi:hypothetical protein Tco_0304415 [Tanacetum coccineum]